jgi:cytochrome bd-type quinol oxidase subunit 2
LGHLGGSIHRNPLETALRPLAVLIAIVFGSLAAMTFGLLSTLIVFFFLKDEHPEFAAELPQLFVASMVVLAMAAAAGASLYSTLRSLKWRGVAMVAMCLIILGGGLIIWPRS